MGRIPLQPFGVFPTGRKGRYKLPRTNHQQNQSYRPGFLVISHVFFYRNKSADSHADCHVKEVYDWLVVEPTHLKNMIVKIGIFPKVRGENKKIFETPAQYFSGANCLFSGESLVVEGWQDAKNVSSKVWGENSKNV